MHLRSSQPLRSARNRQGVAAAELAVCLPVIVLLILAMIESCTMIFVKQSLTIAAYEGVRTALEQDAVSADALLTSQQILTERRVVGGLISINPNNFETLPVGQSIQVTVTAPADSNSVIPGNFFKGKILTATATMMKEFDP